MSLANVNITDTFDVWRTRTNQLIAVYDETNLLSRASYNATNVYVSTTANLTANLIIANSQIMSQFYNNANTIINSNASNILLSNTQVLTTLYNNANTVVPQAVLANSEVISNIYTNANTIIAANASNILLSNTQVLTTLYNNANTVLPSAVISNTQIITSIYDNANTVISSNAANIIYSNTIILTNFYNNANSLVDSYLANNNVTVVIENTNAAYNQANSANRAAAAAFDMANSTPGGAYYVGNNGRTGNEANGKNDIFRVNNNYIKANLYFSDGENGSATGPLTVNTGYLVQINTGARVVII